MNTRFDGFIFRRLTGNTCEDVMCQAGPGLELNQAIYSQRDATFRGGDIRNAVSYNKDQVLLPGIGMRMFANVKY